MVRGGSAFDLRGRLGRAQDFLRDLFGFIHFKIHRDFNAFALDKQTHHTLVRRPDLQVGFKVAFVVDAHGLIRLV